MRKVASAGALDVEVDEGPAQGEEMGTLTSRHESNVPSAVSGLYCAEDEPPGVPMRRRPGLLQGRVSSGARGCSEEVEMGLTALQGPS